MGKTARYILHFFLLLLFCTSLQGSAPSGQGDDERILSFDSHIIVQPDSVMTVSETIRVRSAGEEIKHGIYRDFPAVYRDASWNFSKRGFRVTGVTMDGRTAKYETLWLPNGWRVQIGDGNALLAE